MRIKQLITKSETKLNLTRLTVLVGPNNVGKSQLLRDILSTMTTGYELSSVVLKKIEFDLQYSFDELTEHMDMTPSTSNPKNQIATGLLPDLKENGKIEFQIEDYRRAYEKKGSVVQQIQGQFLRFHVANLDASSRLNLAETSAAYDPHSEKPQNIIQSLFLREDCMNKLKDAFNVAFGMDIFLDYSGMTKFSLRAGANLPNIPEHPRQALPITKKITPIDEHGDGFKSFTGVILGLLLAESRVILLDEPEAFLHPAQSRYLGKWISDFSADFSGQLIIATHNAHFLSGLVSGKGKVDIFRLNRHENETSFTLIPNEANAKLSQEPLLSSQRVLESMFHKGVVVSEADSDRSIYQSVAALEYENSELLFIHAHNKQTIKSISALLGESKIRNIAIVDIDILSDSKEFAALFESVCGHPPDYEIMSERAKIDAFVTSLDEDEMLAKIKNSVEELLGQLERKEHGLDGAKGALNRIKKSVVGWAEVKSNGINYFAESDRPSVVEFLDKLKRKGLFIVPVGELEGWMPLDVKKSKWTPEALRKIHGAGTPEPLKLFVKEIIQFFD